MIFVWLFDSVLWLVKLPFYILPSDTFLPLPAQVVSAVQTLGGYTHWLLYLLGDTAGAAFVLVIGWMIPLTIVAYLWRLLHTTASTAASALIRHKISG